MTTPLAAPALARLRLPLHVVASGAMPTAIFVVKARFEPRPRRRPLRSMKGSRSDSLGFGRELFPNQDNHRAQPMQVLIDWILEQGTTSDDLGALLTGIGERLLESGVPVQRASLDLPTI